jgi:4-alpha-glucanotransferase
VPDDWGIEHGYWDVGGTWHDTPPATRHALRHAMGGHPDVDDPPPRARPVWFVREGRAEPIERPARLVLEDGGVVAASKHLPPDLPIGYHDLHPSDGGPITRLIVTPARCHPPPDERTWALAVQLYAARSRQSWGVGDLGDLRRLADWAGALGAGLVMLNPLHAPLPIRPLQASPYFPSSRLWRNPLYLEIEAVPGFDPSEPVLADAAAAGQALNTQRLIDRDASWEAKRAALEWLWSRWRPDDRFDRYISAAGRPLTRYGAFCALAEHHGRPWPQWPTEHRRPDHPGVDRFAEAFRDRARFHCWLQWLLDEQLAEASSVLPTIADLAIGVDPSGFDGWLFQDVLAPGVRVGAPPDEFNVEGQDWGIPPFVPWRLRAAGYQPLALTLRAAFRHAAAVRIDHVMGLSRLFWIPPDGRPGDGAYVRFPGTELLDVLALESARAGAAVVGEDLGTVEPETREQLGERGVLSYRLVWFEDRPPEEFPEQALAAVTTHDLPTIAGIWTGADQRARRDAGVAVNDEAEARVLERLRSVIGADDDPPITEVIERVHARLARAPSRIVAATLDDLVCVAERPNLPGTTDEWPNWCLALPEPIDDIVEDEAAARVAAAMTAGRRESP